MLRALFESLMGSAFVQVLRFYEQYSLPINAIIVVYGFMMVFSWSNLVYIRKKLVTAMVDQMRQHPDLGPDVKPKRVLKEIAIPWQETLAHARFPLVAKQVAFWPRRCTIDTVQALLPEEDLAREALAMLAELEQRQHGGVSSEKRR